MTANTHRRARPPASPSELMERSGEPRRRWGLALSGGGAFGIANVGIVKVLEEAGLRPDAVAGSSMGAIVGGMYALGVSPAKMEEVAKGMHWLNLTLLSKNPLKGGLHGGVMMQNIEAHLHPVVGDATIGDCKIPFLCLAGRVKEPIDWTLMRRRGFAGYLKEKVERVILLPETRLIDAILASSALPVIFSPVIINEEEYIDLKSFWSIPSLALREREDLDVVIGTNTSPTHGLFRKILPRTIVEYIDEGQRQVRLSVEACDVIVRPKLGGGMHRFDMHKQFIEAGEKAAREKLEEIEKAIA